jgi:hemerythrin-like domain-containing protein
MLPAGTSTATSADTMDRFMSASHRQLERTFQRLLSAVEAGGPDMRELWTELDRGLLAHMEAEERFVLPAFARIDPDEAAALLREHGEIRQQLLELGIAIDLHCIRFAQSRRFIETLRAHADREDRLMYRWADERLGPSLVTAAHHHLAAS